MVDYLGRKCYYERFGDYIDDILDSESYDFFDYNEIMEQLICEMIEK